MKFRTLLVAFWIFVLGNAPAWPAAKDGEIIKDWVIRCGQENQAAAIEKCVMMQSVVQGEAKQRVMQVVVGVLKQNRKAVMVVTVPLGVRLPAGLRFRIDENEEFGAEYLQCLQDGCRGQLLLTEELETAFKAGLKAALTFKDGAGRDIGLDMSLKGFTRALNALR